jgi:hypothetical protein
MNPTYKRAGRIVPGDVVWVLASTSDTAMLPATVIAAETVVNTGLYAPLTLSGSIVVGNVAASVHR